MSRGRFWGSHWTLPSVNTKYSLYWYETLKYTCNKCHLAYTLQNETVVAPTTSHLHTHVKYAVISPTLPPTWIVDRGSGNQSIP